MKSYLSEDNDIFWGDKTGAGPHHTHISRKDIHNGLKHLESRSPSTQPRLHVIHFSSFPFFTAFSLRSFP